MQYSSGRHLRLGNFLLNKAWIFFFSRFFSTSEVFQPVQVIILQHQNQRDCLTCLIRVLLVLILLSLLFRYSVKSASSPFKNSKKIDLMLPVVQVIPRVSLIRREHLTTENLYRQNQKLSSDLEEPVRELMSDFECIFIADFRWAVAEQQSHYKPVLRSSPYCRIQCRYFMQLQVTVQKLKPCINKFLLQVPVCNNCSAGYCVSSILWILRHPL